MIHKGLEKGSEIGPRAHGIAQNACLSCASWGPCHLFMPPLAAEAS